MAASACGESCVCTQSNYVHRAVYKEAEDLLADLVPKLMPTQTPSCRIHSLSSAAATACM